MTASFKGIDCLAVVGVGLIGGSLALALREKGLVRRVVGVGRSRPNLETAQARGILDAFTHDLAEAVCEADLVLVATPVLSIAEVVGRAKPHLEKGTVVTDVGSVKAAVVRDCEAALGADFPFVGGHPIAGTERSGAEAAFPELFRGRKTILTPTARTDPAALALVRGMWEAAGAEVVEMDAEAHDRVLAGVSHLPHMVAYALMDAVAGLEREDGRDYVGLSAGGLRDFTRIAGSDPAMWRDIAVMNREALLRALDRYGESIAALRRLVGASDGEGMERYFAAAQAVRRALLRRAEEEGG